jgi:peptidoglycan/xylan/chitin deacetylase (PgdA/CDA1 family)
VVLFLATGLIEDRAFHRDRMTWPDLADAVGTGLVTIGSHTHNHVDLARVDRRTAEEEMRRSKGLIEDRLGVTCEDFAYPWSVASPPAESLARELFRTAALRWATNRRAHIDPYRLGRSPILRSDGQTFFRAKVAGMLDGEALAYRVLRRGPWRGA